MKIDKTKTPINNNINDNLTIAKVKVLLCNGLKMFIVQNTFTTINLISNGLKSCIFNTLNKMLRF